VLLLLLLLLLLLTKALARRSLLRFLAPGQQR
jgi:hypothetical protein